MSDKRPNILFVQTDQQRPEWVEMNPDIPVRTPHLRQLAERGVWLANAICPSPVCAPSRACLVAGQEYDRTRVWGNNTYAPDNMLKYHLRLRDEAGYYVMGAGKHHVGNNQSGNPPRFHCGVDGCQGVEAWGFSDAIFNAGLNQSTILMRNNEMVPQDAYMAFLHARGLAEEHIADYARRSREGVWTATFPTTLPDDAYFDTWITNNALTLLDRAPDNRPWYLEVNLQNPHHPWDITESMHRWYREPSVAFPLPVFNTEDIAPETHQEVRRNWAATVEHLDSCLGRLVARVRARGDLDNTVIVFTSDHGEMLGDYDQWQKLSPLQASVGVPLVIAGPGVEASGRADAPMTTLDLTASFIEWGGLDPGDDLDSRSLVNYLGARARRHRDLVFSGLSAWRMVFDGRFKLVRGYDPAKRIGGDVFEPMHVPSDETERLQRERPQLLFDLQRNERDDVTAEFPQVFRRLSAALDEHLTHG
ncbi:MAG: sulfatase-like hydrolase/transferase [Gemmatimonadetes bacterium]|nr:sulfatase-like hydrolase/transferase [Gemmatimonadota bacterium]MYB54866.1 sulfatase-like hydrolase/transferase [Gemmatimonadota bacterium]